MRRWTTTGLAAGVTLVLATALGPATGAYAHPSRTVHQVSGASPYPLNCRDQTPGATYLGAEVEPSLAVDPHNPFHLVATWQQDRRSNGGAQGIGVAVSFDAGRTWRRPPSPPFSQCAGGTDANGGNYERASDPWVRFGPDGQLYLIALASSPLVPHSAILLSRSRDGGRTWGPVQTLITDSAPDVLDDKPAVTADPGRRGQAYAVWTRLSGLSDSEGDEAAGDLRALTPRAAGEPPIGPAYFTRTVDGGATWDPPRPILDPGPDAQTTGAQVVVLGDGTLVLVTNVITPDGVGHMTAVRSTDGGRTWQAPQEISTMRWARILDPDTGARVRTADFLPSVAADPRRGHAELYVAWQDAALTGGTQAQVVLSASRDGGRTWSPPARLSRDQGQAFLPQLAVNELGVPMLTYFDFSRNLPDTAALETTLWTRVQVRPGCWTAPRPVPELAIDLRQAPVAGGYFLGDYVGIASHGIGFGALVPVPRLRPDDPADVVYVRLR